MFAKSAKYFDEIYASMDKDYPSEAGKVHKIIQKLKRTQGNTLLDVACGTGTHAGFLGRYYKVEGLDLDSKMLAIARTKYPKLHFHRGDMTNFNLDRQFDIIVCLFSSIGYVKTKFRLQKAINSMNQHLLPGGVLIVEPWFTPKQWHAGRVSILEVNKPDLKIIRMSLSRQKGRTSLIEFQYLIGTSKGIEHQTEIHELGLFTHKEYLDTFLSVGLKVLFDKKGLDGRGLYIGRKSGGK